MDILMESGYVNANLIYDMWQVRPKPGNVGRCVLLSSKEGNWNMATEFQEIPQVVGGRTSHRAKEEIGYGRRHGSVSIWITARRQSTGHLSAEADRSISRMFLFVVSKTKRTSLEQEQPCILHLFVP
ncbi:hypothetical protein CBL_14326 [Carabus blaptoides fortunei]